MLIRSISDLSFCTHLPMGLGCKFMENTGAKKRFLPSLNLKFKKTMEKTLENINLF